MGFHRAAEAAVYNHRKPRKLREACSALGRSSTVNLDILMRGPYSELYLHFVWGTWRRQPFITPGLQRDLYASIAHHSTELGADVMAIGGMPDHVHLLVRFPTTISVSEFMRRVKGGSSHLVTHVMQWPEPFKWQGGYGVFSVSKRNLAAARAYVLNQERHHADGAVHAAFERITQ